MPREDRRPRRLSPREELARIPLYEKGKPPQPLIDVDFVDEVEIACGQRWGAQTELGTLRSVLVQPPTPGPISAPVVREDPIFFGWPKGVPDLDLMRRNHASLVRLLEGEGVEVVYLEAPDSVAGTYTEATCYEAPREPVILKGGALIGRPGIASKRGIEHLMARRLLELGCPILYTVHAPRAIFEAGNVVWLDETHVMIGCGVRTTLEGIREVEPVLRLAGVEEIHVAHLPGYLNFQTERAGGPGGFYHLDMVLGMVDERLAVVYPAGIGYDSIRYLKDKRVELIEAPLDEVQNYACNLLAVRPGRVIMTAGNPRTREALECRGVEVLEMEFGGGRVSGRGPVCSTLPLIRDEGPKI
jgi:N-dimethylarginine dimethylaminohydrolase